MKNRKALFLTAFALLLPASLIADNKHTPPPKFEPSLPWITDLDTALEQSQKTGKPILAEFR